MPNIEVEIRAFLSEDQYTKLLEFFSQNSILIKEDNQESFYFNCPEDLRIQRNNSHSKIWLKKGNLHDDAREEIEIKFDKNQFEDLHKLFLSLGYEVEIKWYRKRFQFNWEGIKVCLDHTLGYGYIIELELMSDNEHKDEALSVLKEKLRTLDVDITSKETFATKYEQYKKNWQDLV
jgi:predicted adenylyl cyclase CyaB